MFKKILIANRGEIAVRIIRTCRAMGIRTVAVYSEADREALHAQLADEAVCIGAAPASESYLLAERILSACLASGAEAIHPGFGFLSENSRFARMCEKCGIVFIGPSPQVMELMGNKSRARSTMEKAGIPVVPGGDRPVTEAEEAKKLADEIGYPLMIKAALGGGGKGMRVAASEEEFAEAFQVAQLESVRAFGDGTMYLEKYIEEPRHVEIQILADCQGNAVQLGERDCSVQRHHQKVLEESPCCALSPEIRKKLGDTAVSAAKAVGYESAGTIEFLIDKEKNFYFMEMNTRIQVEHPVTEMITGIDLIREQICIAAGLPLSVRQEEIGFRGHAIECRINAEDPGNNFCPCPGTIEDVYFPGGCGVRIDTAVYSGYEIPPYYDSMIAKVIVQDRSREEAIDRMCSVLGELILTGVKTNVDFLYDILQEEDFRRGEITTDFIPGHFNL